MATFGPVSNGSDTVNMYLTNYSFLRRKIK